MSTYTEALARLRSRAARGALTPAERERLSTLRRKVTEDMARRAAGQQVDRWIATQNSNGHRRTAPGEADEETMIPAPRTTNKDRAGGRRGSGVWHQGVELPRED